MEEEKVQEFDASVEERVEEHEYLSLEDVVQKTQAKAEISSYPWYSVQKMAREIVVGGEGKTHLCIECLTEITSKAKRTPNDWHAALCNAKSSSNAWLHLQRKHRQTTKDAGLIKEFEKKDAKKRKAFLTTTKKSTQKKIIPTTVTTDSTKRRMEQNDDHLQTSQIGVEVHCEAVLFPSCPHMSTTVKSWIHDYLSELGQKEGLLKPGLIELNSVTTEDYTRIYKNEANELFFHNMRLCCDSIEIIQDDMPSEGLAFWQISKICVHAFRLNDEESDQEQFGLDVNNEEEITACDSLQLPHKSLHGAWNSIIVDKVMKRGLLDYAKSALLFSDRGVNSHIISWNRVCLLHGPPGTGKTSLCRALAHKLAIRLNDRFPFAQLLEIHSHSLFSKWFSESGKLVAKLFEHIQELVDDPKCLVCVLIDEVESLATARSGSSGEPSDAIRTVNAMLTGLDRLKRYSNVLILTTTNITGSVDLAFVDRADIKLFLGLPSLEARYEILRSCIEELMKVGIISSQDMKDKKLPNFTKISSVPSNDCSTSVGKSLLNVALLAEGLSGRMLRKIPFQSHALFIRSSSITSVEKFVVALKLGVEKEHESRIKIK